MIHQPKRERERERERIITFSGENVRENSKFKENKIRRKIEK